MPSKGRMGSRDELRKAIQVMSICYGDTVIIVLMAPAFSLCLSQGLSCSEAKY